MTDEALRELAANRGCKLVKSRVRTPGRGDHGKFGLADAKTGRKILGFGRHGLTATADEIQDFLRGNAAAIWKSSVGKAGGATPAKSKRRPAPESKPKPEPKLVIRDARPKDAEAISALIVTLGFNAGASETRARLATLRKAGHPVLVADRDGVIGVLTTSVMAVLHRPRAVGRVSMLVVDKAERGAGIGTALLAEAEQRLAAAGCGLVEITSNRKLVRAHAFYEGHGYERTSYRFAKTLAP